MVVQVLWRLGVCHLHMKERERNRIGWMILPTPRKGKRAAVVQTDLSSEVAQTMQVQLASFAFCLHRLKHAAFPSLVPYLFHIHTAINSLSAVKTTPSEHGSAPHHAAAPPPHVTPATTPSQNHALTGHAHHSPSCTFPTVKAVLVSECLNENTFAQEQASSAAFT